MFLCYPYPEPWGLGWLRKKKSGRPGRTTGTPRPCVGSLSRLTSRVPSRPPGVPRCDDDDRPDRDSPLFPVSEVGRWRDKVKPVLTDVVEEVLEVISSGSYGVGWFRTWCLTISGISTTSSVDLVGLTFGFYFRIQGVDWMSRVKNRFP